MMSCSDLTKPGLLWEPSGAVISPCEKYRYWLHRSWLGGEGWTVFVMLNPSTADASQDDPTIRRCIRFAKDFGSHGVIVVNLFAWRAIDPRNLPSNLIEAEGPENHAYVVKACELAGQYEPPDMRRPGKVICAWGANEAAKEQAPKVLGWIEAAYGTPRCLGTTKRGFPRHPLYVPASVLPVRFAA
jgi:hypothetical protein